MPPSRADAATHRDCTPGGEAGPDVPVPLHPASWSARAGHVDARRRRGVAARTVSPAVDGAGGSLDAVTAVLVGRVALKEFPAVSPAFSSANQIPLPRFEFATFPVSWLPVLSSTRMPAPSPFLPRFSLATFPLTTLSFAPPRIPIPIEALRFARLPVRRLPAEPFCPPVRSIPSRLPAALFLLIRLPLRSKKNRPVSLPFAVLRRTRACSVAPSTMPAALLSSALLPLTSTESDPR